MMMNSLDLGIAAALLVVDLVGPCVHFLVYFFFSVVPLGGYAGVSMVIGLFVGRRGLTNPATPSFHPKRDLYLKNACIFVEKPY